MASGHFFDACIRMVLAMSCKFLILISALPFWWWALVAANVIPCPFSVAVLDPPSCCKHAIVRVVVLDSDSPGGGISLEGLLGLQGFLH